jgi:hypothetical protein
MEELALIKFAIASSRSLRGVEGWSSLARARARALGWVAWAGLAGSLLGAGGGVGCSKSNNSPKADGSTGMQATCMPGISTASGSATKLTPGQTTEHKLCFQGVSTWYVVDVPSGDTLLDVSAGYPASANSPVTLDVKVYVLSGTSTLTLLQELIAPAQSDAASGMAISTTLLAAKAGSYYLEVSDQHNTNFDTTNSYSLMVNPAVDPDSHEPNDTQATAKPSDSKNSWLAYLGDLDIFTATAGSATDLLSLTVSNPPGAPAINYTFTSSSGETLGEGQVPGQSMPFKTIQSVKAAGTYYVTMSYPTGTPPTRASGDGYLVTFTTIPNPDKLDNHSFATAVCPGGGSGPCSMQYAGSSLKLPPESSYLTVPGQHDYYRIDVKSGAALVLQVGLTANASTKVAYAFDILTPDPNSACQVDSDCVALNAPCTDNDGGSNDDCEQSHACLPPGNYGFCPNGEQCTLCEGAGLCIPGAAGSGGGLCAIPQYLSAYSPSMKLVGSANVQQAQPLFTNGTYYINVHDANYTQIDLQNPYTLTLDMEPEPDPNDQSTDPTKRNNWYDPYPSNMTDESPNKPLAVDITAQLKSGAAVTGYISYGTDSDWYSFQHPCPGQNCALDFQWTQPGPSPVQVAFYMLDNNLLLHQSFAYTGMPTTSLKAPVMSSFDNQSCSQCSFASATVSGADASPPYVYFLRVAAVSQTSWDLTSGGKYSFSVTKGADGCPMACSQGTQACGCYCAATMSCPSPGF